MRLDIVLFLARQRTEIASIFSYAQMHGGKILRHQNWCTPKIDFLDKIVR